MSLFGAATQQTQQPSLFGGAQATTAQPAATGFPQMQSQQPKTGLFGAPAAGSATQPGQTTSLFGQPQQKPAQQQAQTTSLFGQQQPQQNAQPSTGGGLFGTQPAQGGQPAGGLFGNKPAAGTTGGLFGGASAQPSTTPSFGGQPGGLLWQPAPQQQQQQNVQQNQPSLMFQRAPEGQAFAFMTSEEIRHQKEVQVLLDYYSKMISTGSDQNRFRCILYNKISKLSRQEKQFLAENIPQQIGNEPVDLHKWLQAVENNPAKNTLTPTQINSVEELKTRAAATLNAIKRAKERLREVTETMNANYKTCDEDVRLKLQRAYEANAQIISRLTMVFAKFDMVMREQGLIHVDKVSQDQLIQSQVLALDRINNAQDGLQKKLDDTRRTANVLSMNNASNASTSIETSSDLVDSGKSMVTDEDIRDILKVLQKQSQGMKVLKSSVQDSARQTMVMERELDML